MGKDNKGFHKKVLQMTGICMFLFRNHLHTLQKISGGSNLNKFGTGKCHD